MIFQDPVLVAQPAHDRAPGARRAAARAQPRAARRRRRALPRAARPRGPAAERARRLPAPVLGRPAPAHLDRARARARARDPDRRRAGLGARRLGAGDGAQPARRPAPAARPDDAVRRPQHGRRAPRLRPRGRDVPRPHRRAGARASSSSRTRGIPYTQALLRAVPRIAPGHATERDAVVGDPPSPVNLPPRLPLQPALPARGRRLPRRRPAARAARRARRPPVISPGPTPGGSRESLHLVRHRGHGGHRALGAGAERPRVRGRPHAARERGQRRDRRRRRRGRHVASSSTTRTT